MSCIPCLHCRVTCFVYLVYIRLHSRRRTRGCTRTLTPANTRTYAHTRTRAHMDGTRTHTNACAHVRGRTRAHTRTHARPRAHAKLRSQSSVLNSLFIMWSHTFIFGSLQYFPSYLCLICRFLPQTDYSSAIDISFLPPSVGIL